MGQPDIIAAERRPQLGPIDVIRAMLFPVVLGGLFWIAHATGLKDWAIDRGAVESGLMRWGWRAPVVFVTAYAFLPLMFIPRAVLALLGGFLFGWVSILYTWIGAGVGESIAFALAYALGRPFFDKIIRGRGKEIVGWIRLEGFWAVLILRLFPFVPTDVINFGSGFAGVRYRDYIVGTLLGILPGCVLFSLYGQLLEGDPAEFFLAIPLFAAPLVMGLAVARWRLPRSRMSSDAQAE